MLLLAGITAPCKILPSPTRLSLSLSKLRKHKHIKPCHLIARTLLASPTPLQLGYDCCQGRFMLLTTLMDGPRSWQTGCALAPRSHDLIIGRLAGSRLSVMPKQLLGVCGRCHLTGPLVPLWLLKFFFFLSVYFLCQSFSLIDSKCQGHFTACSPTVGNLWIKEATPGLMTTANLDPVAGRHRTFSHCC